MGAGVRRELHFLLRQRFFKPDHVRTQQAAAVWTFGRNIAGVFPARNQRAFVKTFRAADVAVQFDDLAAARALMQAVHILSDELELRKDRFDIRQRVLEVEISDEVLRQRMKEWKPPKPRYPTGVFAKYAALVSSASQGAITRPPK